jgi:hypothetical protein
MNYSDRKQQNFWRTLRKQKDTAPDAVEEKEPDDHDDQKRPRGKGKIGRSTVATWFKRIGYEYYRSSLSSAHPSILCL